MSTILRRSRTRRGASYLDVGRGEVLLLLHGVGLRLEAWTPQIEAFSATHRVVAPDLPGHGESAPLRKDGSLDDFVAWTLDLMDDLGIAGANIAGHSMGALIAGGVVATAPHRVLRVAVLSGVFRRSPEARAAVVARAGEIASGSIDHEGPLRRWFAEDDRKTTAYRLTQDWLSAIDRGGYATAYRAFAHGDAHYAEGWSHVSCPALFLTGTDDPNSTPAMAQAMAAATPGGVIRLIEGHRHMAHLTAPAEVNAALSDWLSTRKASAA